MWLVVFWGARNIILLILKQTSVFASFGTIRRWPFLRSCTPQRRHCVIFFTKVPLWATKFVLFSQICHRNKSTKKKALFLFRLVMKYRYSMYWKKNVNNINLEYGQLPPRVNIYLISQLYIWYTKCIWYFVIGNTILLYMNLIICCFLFNVILASYRLWSRGDHRSIYNNSCR